MDNETKLKIVELYNKSYTTREVEIALGLKQGSARYWLQKQGVELRKTKGLKYHVNKVRVPLEIIQSKVGTPEFDYFLGILATDGNICKSKIALQFAENNKEILEHWRTFLDNRVDIKAYTRKKNNRTYLRLNLRIRK